MNVVGVEDYLLSVISSEMSATASEEFLKAHAVISRSWVMARMAAARTSRSTAVPEGICSLPSLVTHLYAVPAKEECGDVGNVHEYVKWYDHEDHHDFDVCADDHCQRYQGLTRATGDTVKKAIDRTWGQILLYDGEPCDARFSKCCGGIMERFSSCWEDVDKPYLQPLPDTPGHDHEASPFCCTEDKEILAQVLNNYDQETVDFFHWEQEYGRDELSEIISKRSGISIGRLQALEPLKRGESGRITLLGIYGSENKIVVGKELEIRRLLSESHLKSSAFEPEYYSASGKVTSEEDWDRIKLVGTGWGHGVGLCQIGAAVMASKGYSYMEILEHYYPGTRYGNEE